MPEAEEVLLLILPGNNKMKKHCLVAHPVPGIVHDVARPEMAGGRGEERQMANHAVQGAVGGHGAAVVNGAESAVLEEVSRLLAGLRFGSIEIVVHEGAVTQIERRERHRMRPSGTRDN